MMGERLARMGLCGTVDPANPALAALLKTYDPNELWEMLRSGHGHVGWARRAQALDLPKMQREAEDRGIRFLIPKDAEWPGGLADLGWGAEVGGMGGPPLGLWVMGRASLSLLTTDSLAIVGSRASSAYGEDLAHDIAYDVSQAGVTVISGGAYGIDSSAHKGALAADRPTIAVMAGGLHEVYPPGNRPLLDRIKATGLLLSELPPQASPTRHRFLSRNRLIAALSQGTVLVEAALRSGARNTVSWAQSINRMVMAVPGPVFSVNSATPNRLIRDGEATLISSGQEALDLIRPIRPVAEEILGAVRVFDQLTTEQQAVYEALPGRGWLAAEEVAIAAGLPIVQTMSVLQSLERLDLVSGSVGQWRLLKRRI